jgi:hypothetical protein
MSSSLVTNSDYLINLNSGANTLSIVGTVAINGNLSVSGNATLSGNILGDRIQNGTTSIDIPAANGNANITVGGTSNIAVFATTGAYVSGLLSATGNVLTAANVTGGNINTVGIMSAGGAISGNNITTGGFIVATENITGGNLLTGGVVSATGNISGNFYIGNGSQLTGIVAASSYGNANVVANLAALGSNPVSTTGNITAGNVLINAQVIATGIIQSGTGLSTGGYLSVDGTTDLHNTTVTGNVSVTGNVTGGNINTTGIISAGGAISGNNITTGGFIVAAQNITGDNLSATGNITGSNLVINSITSDDSTFVTIEDGLNVVGDIDLSGNITGGNISVAGDATVTGNLNVTGTAGNVVTKSSGAWTVPTGNSTQSFTVDGNNTYQMWVEGNIPNGIIAWNALATVTNINVPVIGQQFAWNYEGGGNLILFTSIPAQIIGTAGAISNAAPVVANTNVFSFGINNASGNTVTVSYGWVKIS